jgi:DDE superfamily endonuclease
MIICTDFCNGKKHDFKLYKESRIYEYTPQSTTQKADTAYKSKDFPNITTPHKKPPKKRKTKLNPKPEPTHLSKEQKQSNHQLSSQRTEVENVIGDIKLFKIHSERYRSRGKRFGLRFNLTCGLTNHQRNLKC